MESRAGVLRSANRHDIFKIPGHLSTVGAKPANDSGLSALTCSLYGVERDNFVRGPSQCVAHGSVRECAYGRVQLQRAAPGRKQVSIWKGIRYCRMQNADE